MRSLGHHPAPDTQLSQVNVTASPAGSGTAIGDATDGDINGNYNSPGSPIYHSAASAAGQFLELDFGGDLLINSVLLFNRSEANGTQNVRVKVIDDTGATVWTQDVNIALGTATPFKFGFEVSPGIGGRKVRVETIASEYLMLAEVQALGRILTVSPPVVENVPATNITGSTADAGANLQTDGLRTGDAKALLRPLRRRHERRLLGQRGQSRRTNPRDELPFTLTNLTPNTPYLFPRLWRELRRGNDWANATATVLHSRL
jgi:hypothetical protein